MVIYDETEFESGIFLIIMIQAAYITKLKISSSQQSNFKVLAPIVGYIFTYPPSLITRLNTLK